MQSAVSSTTTPPQKKKKKKKKRTCDVVNLTCLFGTVHSFVSLCCLLLSSLLVFLVSLARFHSFVFLPEVHALCGVNDVCGLKGGLRGEWLGYEGCCTFSTLASSLYCTSHTCLHFPRNWGLLVPQSVCLGMGAIIWIGSPTFPTTPLVESNKAHGKVCVALLFTLPCVGGCICECVSSLKWANVNVSRSFRSPPPITIVFC